MPPVQVNSENPFTHRKYCLLLFAWLKKSVAARAMRLNEQNGEDFELKYDY